MHEEGKVKISRRDATIGGATLLVGSSIDTLAQAERPLKRAIGDVEERDEVGRAKRLTPKELASRTIYRRAVDAVIWGAPAVTLDMMRQAYFRDAKANYNDIVWWPKGADWKNQSLDVDTSVRYLFMFSNTKNG